ncbi:DEAD/DEAH box helicase [Aeromicrobium sp. Root495]|uniref:DEAD/DEAH box helicase n=1 Tax=Aeromicrobium sp. Root495 TaxID=1736550 RepID=UPI0009E83991|nr:DEAD/DEAH box helicase [Aeromicrobium sp. Root495]
MPTLAEVRLLLRHPVDFRVADDPADSRFVFTAPDGEHEITASDAIGALSQGIRTMNADLSVRAWATPAILALRLMASGQLVSPDQAARSQLLESATSIGPNPAAGQAKVTAFLAALAVDAPAVATTPQQRNATGLTATPRHEPAKPRTFSGVLTVAFRPGSPEGDDAPVADVTLRAKPLDSSWGMAAVAEVWARDQHHFGAGARLGIRMLVSQAAWAWAPLERLLEEPDAGSVAVTASELGQLGTPRATASLRSQRLEIEWPAELVRDIEPRATVRRVEGTSSDRTRGFSATQLFRFDWQVALGDDVLTADEVDELARSQNGLLRLRDRWVFIDPNRLQRVLWQRGREITSGEALRAAVAGEVEIDGIRAEVEAVGWLEDLRERLARRPKELTPIPQPDDLDGSLRDYQLDGLRWMAQLVELGLGACLADDMGLGKTVMLISLHLHRAGLGEKRPTLVVCPASVIGNWEREVRRFAPDVPVHRYHGAGRSLDDVREGFVITTYATMRRDAAVLAAHPGGWSIVVADEAQNVKNVRAAAAKALRTIDSDTRLALTGTPVENNLAELWAILDWTTPGLLGTYEEFRRQWSRPIERHRDRDRTQSLARLIRPFVLRRRKSDPGIAPELPPKIETDYRVNLTREQVGLYEAVVRETMLEIESAQGMQRRGLIVKLLTQLKQICNHPAHFLREPDAPLTGRSGKLAELDELLDEIVSEGGAALVFTQYAQMGRLLARHLEERHMKAQFLHGGTGVPLREKMVQKFQAGDVPVFLLSLKAAGTGLNLTRADHVIHYDRWWNPAVEDQATDRAHRIGQTKVVQVHRLISEGTIEESIAELIAAKRALADAVVNAGEGALTELSDSELAELVRLRH